MRLFFWVQERSELKAHKISSQPFSYGRISETASQYKDCAKTQTACKVIISGGDAQNNGVTEAEIYEQQLLRLGVPIGDLIQEPNSVNTWKMRS